MTTYNTGNPLGSVDVRDLYDNAENLDKFTNGPLDAYPDRFGVPRQSWAGMEAEFDADQVDRAAQWAAFLLASGYQVLGPYGAGLVFTAPNQLFSYLGEFYAPGPAITLPYTTTGAGAGEIANFRSVGDAVLRSDLAGTAGSSLVGYLPVGTGAVATTVQAKLQQKSNILDFYANGVSGMAVDPTGVINSTAGIQAFIDSGLSQDDIPDGTYLIDTLYFPDSPSDAIPTGGRFVGSPRVIFLQATANTVLFKKVASAGRCYNWEIGPFCVKPKAGSSSTTSAINTTGMTGCTFNRIQGLSNGSAGFYAVIDTAASPYLSYANTYNNFTLVGTTGYTMGIYFSNNGTGEAGNANLNSINDPFIYNNTGLSVGIDLHNSYAVTVTNPQIEANPSAKAFVMGVATTIIGGALEANLADFEYGGVAPTPKQCTVLGTYLATAHTIDFSSGASGNLWINVVEAATQTWTAAGATNAKVNYGDFANPAALTITQTAGLAGTISGDTHTISGAYSPFTRRVTFQGRVMFSPTASSDTITLNFAAPSGWSIVAPCFGVLAAGEPVLCRTTIDNSCQFPTASVANHYIDYTIELARS